MPTPSRGSLENWKFKVLLKNKIIVRIRFLIVNFCIPPSPLALF